MKPARACAGALASARSPLPSPMAATPPPARARSGALAPDSAPGAAPDLAPADAPASASSEDPPAGDAAAAGAADAPAPPNAPGGVPEAHEKRLGSAVAHLAACWRNCDLKLTCTAGMCAGLRRPPSLQLLLLQCLRLQPVSAKSVRAGARPAWDFSAEVATLVENLRGAAARATPKEGTRQLPKPVLQLLLSLACALRREVGRKREVASENEARAHAQVGLRVLLQDSWVTGRAAQAAAAAAAVAGMRAAARGRLKESSVL